jgi:hypothetical protein
LSSNIFVKQGILPREAVYGYLPVLDKFDGKLLHGFRHTGTFEGVE